MFDRAVVPRQVIAANNTCVRGHSSSLFYKYTHEHLGQTLFFSSQQEPTALNIRLVIFDVDGTILQAYSWQHLHEKLGTWNQAQTYYNQFFESRITYKEWAELDAALWKGQPLPRITQIIDEMPYMRGARETLATLKKKGVKIFLLSAGLTRVAERIHRETCVDGYRANTLISKEGHLTGEVEVDVSFYNKDSHLPHILREFDLASQECAAVGDDPTLIPLFKRVALPIAFNPANKDVEKTAGVTVRSNDLRHVLPHILPHVYRESATRP